MAKDLTLFQNLRKTTMKTRKKTQDLNTPNLEHQLFNQLTSPANEDTASTCAE